MPTLSIDPQGYIVVDDRRIDCLIATLEVQGGVVMNSDATDSTSGKTNTFTGYDDMGITLTGRMSTTRKYDALATLNDAFKTLVDGAPVVYTLDFPLATAMHVSTAIIKELKVSQEKGTQTIHASISLMERDPVISATQNQQQRETQAHATESQGNSAPSDSDTESLMLDESEKQSSSANEQRLSAGYTQ